MLSVDSQFKKNIVETNTIKPIFDGAINQQHDKETWIIAVNVKSNSFDDIQTEIH